MFRRVVFNGRKPWTVEVIAFSDALPQEVVDAAWDALAEYLGSRIALQAMLDAKVEMSAFTEQDLEDFNSLSEDLGEMFAECKTSGRHLVRTVYRLA
jgi:Tfp pilus assembly PilM family ATPase